MRKSLPEEPRPLAPAPVIGAAFGALIVLGCVALSANSLMAFFSLGGLIVVVGGVIAVAFMSFEANDVRTALNAIAEVLRQPGSTHESLHRDMRNIMEWARIMKEKGRRSLESAVTGADAADPFVKYGLNMVLGDYTPDEVRAMMTTAAEAHHERDSAPVDVLQAMTSHAPAFGMVGTLVGMVAMLCNLTDNVAGIGSTLAVAFLSTLYGVISARMVYMPAASRLRHEVDARTFRCHLIAEGMAMLASNKTPTQIQDRLNSFLAPEVRDYFDSLAKKPAGALAQPIETTRAANSRRGYLAPQLKAIGT